MYRFFAVYAAEIRVVTGVLGSENVWPAGTGDTVGKIGGCLSIRASFQDTLTATIGEISVYTVIIRLVRGSQY